MTCWDFFPRRYTPQRACTSLLGQIRIWYFVTPINRCAKLLSMIRLSRSLYSLVILHRVAFFDNKRQTREYTGRYKRQESAVISRASSSAERLRTQESRKYLHRLWIAPRVCIADAIYIHTPPDNQPAGRSAGDATPLRITIETKRWDERVCKSYSA